MLLVMFFLWALHGHYSALMEQFWSHFKSLETASINLVVKDVAFHDSFTLHNPKSKLKSPVRVPAAASANTDRQSKVWQTPFDWLATYSDKCIKTGHVLWLVLAFAPSAIKLRSRDTFLQCVLF